VSRGFDKQLGGAVRWIQFQGLPGECQGLVELMRGHRSKRQIGINRCGGRADVEGLLKLGARIG